LSCIHVQIDGSKFLNPQRIHKIWRENHDWRLSNLYWVMMFKRQALVLTMCLNKLSKPFPMLSMPFSKASNLSCAACIPATLLPSLTRLLKVASTHCNSLEFSVLSSHVITPLCINFASNNHLVPFDFGAGTAKKASRDWKIDMFITMTSLSTLVKTESCWSWSKSGDTPNLLSICFKVVINFLAFFFIFFEKELYSATTLSMLESPFLLRRAEWRAWTFSLICNKVSLVMSQISKILTEPSRSSSVHLSPWWLEINFWVDGMLRRFSTQIYKSDSKDKPLPIDFDVDVEVASQVLNLLSSSSTLIMLGWDPVGKLFERTWNLFAMVTLFVFFSFTKEAQFFSAITKSLTSIYIGASLIYSC